MTADLNPIQPYVDRLINMVAEVWDVPAAELRQSRPVGRTTAEARRVVVYLAAELMPRIDLGAVCRALARHPSYAINAILVVRARRLHDRDLDEKISNIEDVWLADNGAARTSGKVSA